MSKPLISKVYATLLLTTKTFVHGLDKDTSFSARDLKRIIQRIADLVDSGKSLESWIGLSQFVRLKQRRYVNIANASVYAMLLGRQVGLDRKQLADLGLTSVFVQMGYYRVSNLKVERSRHHLLDILDLARVPVMSSRAVLDRFYLSDAWINRFVSCFESEMDADGNFLERFPKYQVPLKPTLFSDIIAITSHYERLTSKQEYRDAYQPDESLKIMYDSSYRVFNNVLLKQWVSFLGEYPIGSVVELETRDKGVVVERGDGVRPVVLTIVDKLNNRLEEPIRVDLSEKNDNGQYKNGVVKTVHSSRYDINVPYYFSEHH